MIEHGQYRGHDVSSVSVRSTQETLRGRGDQPTELLVGVRAPEGAGDRSTEISKKRDLLVAVTVA